MQYVPECHIISKPCIKVIHRLFTTIVPIVGMGLFMDMDGIPISFSIYPGNRNEQVTMIPLEEKMLSDFELSKFIVCTDAELSSATNRVFNTYDEADGLRGYITTQPIKTLKDFLQQWCMAEDGWILDGDTSGKKYALSELDDEQDKDKIFYKTRWIKEEGTVHTQKKGIANRSSSRN